MSQFRLSVIIKVLITILYNSSLYHFYIIELGLVLFGCKFQISRIHKLTNSNKVHIKVSREKLQSYCRRIKKNNKLKPYYRLPLVIFVSLFAHFFYVRCMEFGSIQVADGLHKFYKFSNMTDWAVFCFNLQPLLMSSSPN